MNGLRPTGPLQELLGIWSQLGRPNGFITLSPGGECPSCHRVSARPWSVTPLLVEPLGEVADLADWCNRQGFDHVVLMCDAPLEFVDYCYDLPLAPRCHLWTVRRDDRDWLSLDGDIWFDPGYTAMPVAPRDARVRLRGARERLLALRDLPVTLVVATDNDRCGLIRLDAPDGTSGLPGPAMFALTGGPRGRLVIDLERAPDGALRWCPGYHVDDGHGAVRALDLSDCAAPGAMEVAIIFDRTCPDQSAWADALLLSRGQLSLAADPYAGDAAQTGPAWPGFNREIRAGLCDVLRGLASDPQLSVTALTCADIEGHGLSAPHGVTLPRTACLVMARQSATQAADWFADACYAPGLDVWDPLDAALRLARNAFSSAAGGARAVLFIGNSPPPPDIDASEWEAVRSHPGHRTSLRVRSMTWTDDLRWCRREGIPVFYLFLTHRPPSPDAPLDFEAFATLQQRIRAALAAGLEVLDRPADAAGVADGVRSVLQLLRAGEHWSSCVEFADAPV